MFTIKIIITPVAEIRSFFFFCKFSVYPEIPIMRISRAYCNYVFNEPIEFVVHREAKINYDFFFNDLFISNYISTFKELEKRFKRKMSVSFKIVSLRIYQYRCIEGRGILLVGSGNKALLLI